MRIAAALIVAMFTSLATAQAGKWPNAALYGRIVNVLYHGVPAAEVWVTDLDNKKVARAFADGDGYYQLRRLPTGALRVHASGDGMVTGSMPVKSGGFVREATLTLHDAAPIQGFVMLPDGTPAQDADVVVYDTQSFPEHFFWSAETTTDASGLWRIDAAPLRELKIRAFVASYKIGEQTIPRTRPNPIKLVLPTDRTKQHTVTVADVPAGVTALARCIPGSMSTRYKEPLPARARQATVGADGTVTMWATGVYHELRVTAPGHRSMPIAIPCAPDKELQLQFRLEPLSKRVTEPHTTIRGHVVDSLGTAIADVTVVAIEHELRATPAVTGADGSFVIEVPASENVLYQIGLLSREWRLGDRRCTVGLDGITWQSKAAKADEPIRLHATKAGTLRGTLTGPNGTPLAAAKVMLIGITKLGKPPKIISATDSAGRFDFAGIALGHYQLSATTAGGNIGTAKLKVFGDQEASIGQLKFAAGSELRGSVTDEDGKPIAGVPVAVIALDPRIPAAMVRQMWRHSTHGRFAFSDRLGNYRLPMVTEGEWMAVVAGSTRRNNQGSSPFTMEADPVTVHLILK